MDSEYVTYSGPHFSVLSVVHRMVGTMGKVVRSFMLNTLGTQQFLEKKELFAYVWSKGLKIDDSLLHEFQEQGVMMPPRKRGKGRGKGSKAFWTIQQRDLLLGLCRLQQQCGAYHIGQRCNLPVWVWLYWGDEYGVTLEQVKRVMRTWARPLWPAALSRRQAQKAAKLLVEQVANRHDGGKQQAIREIADMLYHGAMTAKSLTNSLYHVFDPIKRPNGPHDIPIRPENMSGSIEARVAAVEALASESSEIANIHWEWARIFHISQLSQYAKEQPGYARETAGTPVEQVFSMETLERWAATACEDLAMVLGLGLLYPLTPGLPEQLRLDVWKRRVKSVTLTSRPTPSPVMLPNGAFPMYLEMQATIHLIPEKELKVRR